MTFDGVDDRRKLCDGYPPKFRIRNRQKTGTLCLAATGILSVLFLSAGLLITIYAISSSQKACQAGYHQHHHEDDASRDNRSQGLWVKVSDLPAPMALSVMKHVNGTERKRLLAIKKRDYEQVPTPDPVACCGSIADRLECTPGKNADNVTACASKGCCYDPKAKDGSPRCFFPSNYARYHVETISGTTGKTVIRLERRMPSGFAGDSDEVLVEIVNYDTTTVRIKIYDPNEIRFIVPTGIPDKNMGLAFAYNTHVDEKGNVKIFRAFSSTPLLQVNMSTLIFAKQFMQLQVKLPSPYIYGLGENQGSFLKDVNWRKYTLWNYGIPPVDNTNLYGTHPFLLNIDSTGKSHGVFLYNSNAMDVILTPSPSAVYRPIGGIFDFFVFVGSEPDDVIQQYTALVGRPFMPPYWSLGFHLSRYGYNTLNNTKATLKRNLDVGIPVEAQWNDIDYMDKYNDFTFDKKRFGELPQYVRELHNQSRRYVAIMDPAVSASEELGTYPPYDDGLFFDIFTRLNGEVFTGKVWNLNSSAFPDFTHPRAEDYWFTQFRRFYNDIPIDGVWIDMNEPFNWYNGTIDGCDTSSYDFPEYQPGSKPLNQFTICMTSKHFISSHYDIHNLYAYFEAKLTYNVMVRLLQKRLLIISRASYAGQGQYSGHWSGDIDSTWQAMQRTIPALLNFNLFGMPMMGSDICGFQGNTTEELCTRWQALGAFYPFSRNHNDFDTIDQDPAAMGSKVVEATKNALEIRYKLLPYLYTLFYNAHVTGSTVARPLFFEFPKDVNTFGIATQFMWGSGILIIPVLEQHTTKVQGYVPEGVWYHLTQGTIFNSKGQNMTFDVPYNETTLLIRGGMVIPTQEPAPTTTESRQNPFHLLVAPGSSLLANGELFADDGESLGSIQNNQYSKITFTVIKNTLFVQCAVCNYKTNLMVNNVTVFGVTTFPGEVTVNEKPADYLFDNDAMQLHVLNLNVSMADSFAVHW